MINNNNLADGKLSESPKSYWIDSVVLPNFSSLNQDIHVDVAIIGGGITGLTSAFLLANEGLRVAVLEANKLLNGTTGHTTAKATAQHDLIFDELIHNMGENKAKLYYQANSEALSFIEQTVMQYQIDCDFQKQDAYIYATTEEYAQKIVKEAEAYQKLGILGELVDSLPLNIKIQKGLVMKNQAQLHPLKLLSQLVPLVAAKGGQVFENTTAMTIETGQQPTILTRDNYRVTAKHVLICSHFPFYEGTTGLYSQKMYASRSYILAANMKEKFPNGMYISVDKPTRSLRSVTINGEECVLIVGEVHKAGHGGDTIEHYNALGTFGQKVFGLEDIIYRWSAQDLITPDKIPYIGKITDDEPNILVATGFKKWGVSNGVAAALLLRDIVLNKANKYQDLYSPARFNRDPALQKTPVQGENSSNQLNNNGIKTPSKSPEDLANDEGGIITINRQIMGAYRDKQGVMHIVDITCTHKDCKAVWNNGDRTWDCPCHGCRYSYTGDVIEGPAKHPLKRYDHQI